MGQKQYDTYGNPIQDGTDPYGSGDNNPPGQPVSGYDPNNPTPSTTPPTSGTGGNPAPPVIDTPTTGGAPAGPSTGSGPAATGVAPTGGSLTDPAYVDKLLAYYGSQPGANPSVKNDPNYWRQRIASGAFGNDEAYLVKRFMTPEGAPEGSGQSDTSGLEAMLSKLFGGNPQSDFSKGIHDQITKGIGDAQKPVDPNSPEVAGPNAAFDAEAQAARRQAQSASAERGYASGATSGALDANTSAGFEGMGRAEASHSAGTIANIYSQNRTKLQNLLQTGAGVLSADEQRQLTGEIAAIDAELRKLGMGNQDRQFYDQLSSNMGSNANNLDNIFARLFGG